MKPIPLFVSAKYGLQGLDKNGQHINYESDSAYNYIQVHEKNGYRVLSLNKGQGIHSNYHPTRNNFSGTWEQVLSAPFYNPVLFNRADVQHMAILGLAVGTGANQAAQVFPHVIMDGYEIDPEIIQVGFDFFELNATQTQVFAQDASWGITHNINHYNVISFDAYKTHNIPWHLTTLEFFQTVADRLTNDGMLVIIVDRIFNDRRLVDDLYTTVASIFPSVYIIDIPDIYNTILFATRQLTHADNLIQNYNTLSKDKKTPSLLLSTLEIAILNQQAPSQKGQIFTDDHALVEWITNDMTYDFFNTMQIEEIQ